MHPPKFGGHLLHACMSGAWSGERETLHARDGETERGEETETVQCIKPRSLSASLATSKETGEGSQHKDQIKYRSTRDSTVHYRTLTPRLGQNRGSREEHRLNDTLNIVKYLKPWRSTGSQQSFRRPTICASTWCIISIVSIAKVLGRNQLFACIHPLPGREVADSVLRFDRDDYWVTALL